MSTWTTRPRPGSLRGPRCYREEAPAAQSPYTSRNSSDSAPCKACSNAAGSTASSSRYVITLRWSNCISLSSHMPSVYKPYSCNARSTGRSRVLFSSGAIRPPRPSARMRRPPLGRAQQSHEFLPAGTTRATYPARHGAAEYGSPHADPASPGGPLQTRQSAARALQAGTNGHRLPLQPLRNRLTVRYRSQGIPSGPRATAPLMASLRRRRRPAPIRSGRWDSVAKRRS